MQATLQDIERGPSLPLLSGISTAGQTVSKHRDIVKTLIWIYFFLLIFEGALRKWLLPGLATPLLIIRDPLALVVVVITWRRGLLPVTPYLFGMVIIGTVAVFTATILGHGNLWVALFGARIFLLHYPMIFAVGRTFTRGDVVLIGKATLWIAFPVAILTMLQFYSPQSAWVNMGVGGNIEGSGFSGAMGYFRPSATFSFTNGTSLFFGFAAAFIVYFWLDSQRVNRLVLLAATFGLLIAVPLSISRSLLFGVALSVLFAIFAIARNPKFFARIVVAVIGIALLTMILINMEFFQNAVTVFSTRFEVANETEGGLDGVFLDRYLGGMIEALTQASQFPFFGYGMGLGTNVGSMLTRGEVVYLISEGEWGRLIGELGPLMGIAVIALRIGLSIKMSLASYAKLVHGDFLPWLLVSFCLIVLPQSQWGQPTTLGFCVLACGLMLASLRIPVKEKRKPHNK